MNETCEEYKDLLGIEHAMASECNGFLMTITMCFAQDTT